MSSADARASAGAGLHRLGVADRRPARIETLSQGNQQSVQLAAALVHDPDLLVLDEPFAGLDPVGVDEMSVVLAERAAEGATVLFSSHQLDLVQDICEAVAIIHRGRLVAEGGLEELRRGGEPRLAVRVTGDPQGRWTGVSRPQPESSASRRARSVALAPGATRKSSSTSLARPAPVEHFVFERPPALRRVSRVVGSGSTKSTGGRRARRRPAGRGEHP